ncbi:MAG: hypothetical protein C7B45_05170 [Sulfobacillus acidophilus]|uniref:Uncharacterized protein n=1 Tax=Sulfobacillus acidophilus TaxID=53633 RepID=A0A2T2WKU9_9FIRM|nr:MAG: hypothetical protein C7B45_05170 [Sulfobacillus acidophilus]
MRVIRAVAVNTWRLAWRDPLTRIELGMLAVLALLAAIAAIGSPTSGDGAVQMFAVAYSATPFALVLIVGQIGRNVREEAGWWSRPLSRDQVLLGRFAGYAAVGSTLVGVTATWGWILMTVLAHLDPWSGLVWTFWFALLTIPAVLTVTGGALWLQTAVNNPHRYFAWAIILSLIVAFAEYKLCMFTAAWPHLSFFNPFPGFLELGLALPPSLLTPIGISGWIWINRVLWGTIGMLLVVAAIRRPVGPYPMRPGPTTRIVMALLGVGAVACAVILAITAQRLSPPVSSTYSASTNFFCRDARIQLTVNAQTGQWQGQFRCRPSRAGTLRFAANAGLTLTAFSRGRQPISLHVGLVSKDSAQRQWQMSILRRHTVTFVLTGHLLPYPSTLPYRPFSVGQVYSGLAAGYGHVFIAEAQKGLPTCLTASTPVQLSLRDLAPGPLVTNAVWDQLSRVWVARLGTLTVDTGDLVKIRRGPTTIWLPEAGGISLAPFLPYVGSLRSLTAWLPLPKHISFVPSPVISQAAWHTPDIVYTDVHPFVEPRDPISNSDSPPTNYTATLTLARLLWTSMAATPKTDQDVVLTVLLMYSHSNPVNFFLLLDQVQQGRVTDVGPLTPNQRHNILRTWQLLQSQTRRRQRIWLVHQYRTAQTHTADGEVRS